MCLIPEKALERYWHSTAALSGSPSQIASVSSSEVAWPVGHGFKSATSTCRRLTAMSRKARRPRRNEKATTMSVLSHKFASLDCAEWHRCGMSFQSSGDGTFRRGNSHLGSQAVRSEPS